MSRHVLHCVVVALLFSAGQTFTTSVAAPSGAGGIMPRQLPGVYELTFLHSNGEPVVNSTLFVFEELVLKAHVMDVFGADAQRGSVRFQVCTRGGKSLPQMDPAPAADCDINQTAGWTSIITMKVDAGMCPGEGTGYACVNFGLIQRPRTIGFRFVYTAQGSGILSGVSESKDATWVQP